MFNQLSLGFGDDTFFAALSEELALLEGLGVASVRGFQEDCEDLPAAIAAKAVRLTVKCR